MHTDRGRGEGVVGWEDERAPVLTAVVGSVLGSCDDVMPSGELYVSRWLDTIEASSGRCLLQDVGLGGVGSDVRRGVLSDGFVFARQLEGNISPRSSRIMGFGGLARLCAARVAMVNCADGDVSRWYWAATVWQRMKTPEGIGGRGTRGVSALNERSRVGFTATLETAERRDSSGDEWYVKFGSGWIGSSWILGGCDVVMVVCLFQGWKVESR